MKRYAVFVGTTAGPVRIERLTIEPVPQSMACVQRTSTVLSISAAYDDFVRLGSGVIMRDFGALDNEAYRLDFSEAIISGTSWQAGAYLVHAFEAGLYGILAAPGETYDGIIWITGCVDCDLGVQTVSHIPEKVAASRNAMNQWLHEGIPVLMFVPKGKNEQEALDCGIPDAVRFIGVGKCDDIFAQFSDQPIVSSKKRLPKKTPPSQSISRNAMTIILGLCVGTVGAGYYVHGRTTDRSAQITPPAGDTTAIALPKSDTVLKPAPETASLTPLIRSPLQINERRPPIGKNCTQVHFNRVAAELRPITQTASSQSETLRSSLANLCGLSFEIKPQTPVKFVALHMTISSGGYLDVETPPVEFTGNLPVQDTLSWPINLPRRMDVPFDYQMVTITADKPVGTQLSWLKKQPDLTAAVTQLRQQGLQVTILRHVVSP